MPVKAKPLATRFWSKLEHDPATGCWLWTGAIKKPHRTRRGCGGYGLIARGGRHDGTAIATTIAWELTFGPVPTGLLICHTCDVRRCCNPGHLFLGTHEENMQDMVAKNRHGMNGAKLTPANVIEIRRVLSAAQPHEVGELAEMFADTFGVSVESVRNIYTGRTWSSVVAPVEEGRLSA